MSTKKLQIVTPIVTSVNGQTGDVTLDISGGGATTPMKKLTFTGGATGEYDGSSDVSVTIPEDRVYVLNVTPNEDGTLTIDNNFDEAIAASNSGKIIASRNGVIVTLTDYEISNPNDCHICSISGDEYMDARWVKATGLGTIESYCKVPTFSILGADTPLASSGAAYWDYDKSEWTIKDVTSYKAGNGISISDDGTISVTAAKIYSGDTEPNNALGEDGDIYIQTGA